MKILGKYLKPFIALLLVSIVLLYVQAYANLKLPDYMSDMVNVGIQNGGIEDVAPPTITGDSLELLEEFNVDGILKTSYVQDGERFKKKNLDTKEAEEVTQAYNRAVYAFFEMSKDAGFMEGAKAPKGDLKNSPKIDEISQKDFKKLVLKVKSMPAKVKQPFIDKSSEAPSLITSQMGSVYTRLDYHLQGKNLVEIQKNYVYKVGLFMVIISIIGAVATIVVNYISAKVATGFTSQLRKDVFNRVIKFSSQEYNKFQTSSLITRTTNDMTQIQTTLAFCIKLLVFAPIQGVGAYIMAVEKSPSMSWIIGLSVGTIFLVVLGIFLILVPKFKRIQHLADRLNAITRENLIGAMDVRAFNNQKIEIKRFDKVSKENRGLNKAIQVVFGFMMPIMTFVMNVAVLAIIWFGVSQIEASSLEIGDMMAFVQYTIQIIFSFLILTMVFVMVPRAVVSLGRIGEIMNTDFTVLEKEEPLSTTIEGDIVFNNVSFSYENALEPVVKNINLHIKKGEYTAIIGTTGSGKSTLVNLIPRFFDVTKGEVLIDGIDVRNYSISHLRENISYAPQKSLLFKGDLRSNMLFGDRSSTDEEINQVLDLAQARSFLEEKSGLDTEVAQLGKNFSGGQKQRISIARALIKKAKIFIFDDSFSALDADTDAKLREKLSHRMKDETIIIVAQRLGTIINADKIVVLDKGEVVGVGTHRELMRTCSTYIDIANSQLGTEVFGE